MANLIVNPGFEVDLTGWTPSGATLTRDTGTKRTGVASMYIATVAADNTADNILVTGISPNTSYTVSCWVNVAGTSAKIGWNEFQSNGAYLTTQDTTYTTGITSGVWSYIEQVGTTNALTDRVSIHVGIGSIVNNLYVDDVFLDVTSVGGGGTARNMMLLGVG